MICLICEIRSEMYTPEAFRIYSACMYRPSLEKYADTVANYLSDPETHCFASFEGKHLIGMIVVRNGEILGIAVLDAFRNQGTGRALIEHSQQLYPVLIAETDDDSVGFYRRCGFSCEAFDRTFPDGIITRYRCIRNSF